MHKVDSTVLKRDVIPAKVELPEAPTTLWWWMREFAKEATRKGVVQHLGSCFLTPSFVMPAPKPSQIVFLHKRHGLWAMLAYSRPSCMPITHFQPKFHNLFRLWKRIDTLWGTIKTSFNLRVFEKGSNTSRPTVKLSMYSCTLLSKLMIMLSSPENSFTFLLKRRNLEWIYAFLHKPLCLSGLSPSSVVLTNRCEKFFRKHFLYYYSEHSEHLFMQIGLHYGFSLQT